MNMNNLRKKAKNIARTALLLFLCAATSLAVLPTEASGASYQGYEWVKIKSRAEFEEFMDGALKSGRDNIGTKSDRNIKTGEELTQGAKKAKASDWIRIMMIYDSNRYFISGNNSCNNNKSFLGQRIKSTYGIDVDKDKFTTISGLNTPYIKYEGYDGDNNCGRYYVRFADNDQLGAYYWTMYVSWAGVAHHAACKCNFRRPGQTVSNWKDDSNWWSYQTFQWSGDKVRVFYNIKGAADRGWEDQGGGEIECGKSFDDTWFTVYLGYKVDVPVYQSSTHINPGKPVSWNGAMIDENVTVTIPEGATLVLDGICYNDGIISVDGGTLIIRGAVDTHIGKKDKAGSLKIYSGSMVIIEETGALIGRNPEASYYMNGSHLEVQGIAVFPAGIWMYESDIRGGYGSAICLGVIPNESSSQSTYTKAWVAKNNTNSLAALCSNNTDIEKAQENCLYMYGYSTIQSNGIVYMNPNLPFSARANTYDADFSPYAHFYKSSNINASLKSMLKHW